MPSLYLLHGNESESARGRVAGGEEDEEDGEDGDVRVCEGAAPEASRSADRTAPPGGHGGD